MSDTFLDPKPFSSDHFDVNAYANAVLSGKIYDPEAPSQAEGSGSGSGKIVKGREAERGDVGVESAKSNYGIEDITKQSRSEITSSYPSLLDHSTTSLALSSHLDPIRTSLTSLSASLERSQVKIHEPHVQLASLVTRSKLLAQATDLVRRAARFVLVARRSEGQMERVRNAVDGSEKKDGQETPAKGEGERDRELAKAASSAAESDSSLKPPTLREDGLDDGDDPGLPSQSSDFVQAYIPTVEQARDAIIQEMESMVVNGLAESNQPSLSSSLQTAHNLQLLPESVSNLLADLNDAVTSRITKAFDSAAIGKEVAGKDTASSAIKFASRSRIATEPTSANKDQWVNVLWARLGRVIEDVANCCIKVYTLEKVLRVKRDAITQVEFLEEVMKTLDEKPSFTFWTTLAKAFENQTKQALQSHSWSQQALSVGYPRLLRLFHDFFAKIAVHTDTVYTWDHQSPEAVSVLRSVSSFETLYLSRSTTRMTDIVNASMSSYLSGRGNPPGASEGVAIARTVTNELDSARFDPLLVRTVARNAVKVLDNLVNKIDGALVRDFTATSLIGPNATAAQSVNASLISALYHCRYNSLFVEQEFPGKVWEIVSPIVSRLEKSYTKIVEALDSAIKREAASILARSHRVDFAKPVDPMSMDGGASPYMQDSIDKIGFIKSQSSSPMSLGEYMREWILDSSRFIIRTFLSHASIARPSGENGKLKLTGDMTELEMGISSLLSTGQMQGQRGGSKIERVGDEYLASRSFRTSLFSDPASLANPVETVHSPPLIVSHHIIVTSSLRLPHEVHGWTEAEYVLWVQKHKDEQEQWNLVEAAVKDQTSKVEGEQDLHCTLIREVLEHARHEDHTPAA